MNRTMTLIRYLCPSALAALWLALAPPAAAQGAAPDRRTAEQYGEFAAAAVAGFGRIRRSY